MLSRPLFKDVVTDWNDQAEMLILAGVREMTRWGFTYRNQENSETLR